jgi:hypothetical protein
MLIENIKNIIFQNYLLNELYKQRYSLTNKSLLELNIKLSVYPDILTIVPIFNKNANIVLYENFKYKETNDMINFNNPVGNIIAIDSKFLAISVSKQVRLYKLKEKRYSYPSIYSDFVIEAMTLVKSNTIACRGSKEISLWDTLSKECLFTFKTNTHDYYNNIVALNQNTLVINVVNSLRFYNVENLSTISYRDCNLNLSFGWLGGIIGIGKLTEDLVSVYLDRGFIIWSVKLDRLWKTFSIKCHNSIAIKNDLIIIESSVVSVYDIDRRSLVCEKKLGSSSDSLQDMTPLKCNNFLLIGKMYIYLYNYKSNEILGCILNTNKISKVIKLDSDYFIRFSNGYKTYDIWDSRIAMFNFFTYIKTPDRFNKKSSAQLNENDLICINFTLKCFEIFKKKNLIKMKTFMLKGTMYTKLHFLENNLLLASKITSQHYILGFKYQKIKSEKAIDYRGSITKVIKIDNNLIILDDSQVNIYNLKNNKSTQLTAAYRFNGIDIQKVDSAKFLLVEYRNSSLYYIDALANYVRLKSFNYETYCFDNLFVCREEAALVFYSFLDQIKKIFYEKKINSIIPLGDKSFIVDCKNYIRIYNFETNRHLKVNMFEEPC